MYIRKLQKEDVSPDGDFIRILSQLSISDGSFCDYGILWNQYDRQGWFLAISLPAYTHVVVAVDNDVVALAPYS